eukprot:1141834-Pelagomonas_calceolata.AAC.5
MTRAALEPGMEPKHALHNVLLKKRKSAEASKPSTHRWNGVTKAIEQQGQDVDDVPAKHCEA